jgi:hypothetical protein
MTDVIRVHASVVPLHAGMQRAGRNGKPTDGLPCDPGIEDWGLGIEDSASSVISSTGIENAELRMEN